MCSVHFSVHFAPYKFSASPTKVDELMAELSANLVLAQQF